MSLTYEDLPELFSRIFIVAQPIDEDRRRWVFDANPKEVARRALCRQVAQDIAAAGLGWHEDAIERLTRPPIVYSNFTIEVPMGKPSSQFPHRRCGIKSRCKWKRR